MDFPLENTSRCCKEKYCWANILGTISPGELIKVQPLGTSASLGTGIRFRGRQDWVWKALTAMWPQARPWASVSYLNGESSYSCHPRNWWQNVSERIPVQHIMKNLWHSNIKYVSAVIIITCIGSHKTPTLQLLTECHHVRGGVWLKKSTWSKLPWSLQP